MCFHSPVYEVLMTCPEYGDWRVGTDTKRGEQTETTGTSEALRPII